MTDIDALVARLLNGINRCTDGTVPENGTAFLGADTVQQSAAALTALSDEIAVLKEREGAGPYQSQAEAWNDAIEKSAQIVERYNAAFIDPSAGGAPDDIRALKRAVPALTDKAGS